MRIIKVNLKKRSYNIIVGRDILSRLGKYLVKLRIGKDAYIITNSLVKNKYSKELAGSLTKAGFNFKFKTIPDTEKSKGFAVLSAVIKDLAKFDLKKQTFIIALGGGVVGDLSGFVASVYKRGIPYIQIPTTLLAQVDSSIGGKTAIDLQEGKNLIGAFYQPRLVFSDVKLLATLDKKQLRSGLAEVIKYGVIRDKGLFQYLEAQSKNILKSKLNALEHIVNSSAKIKAGIVQADEKEEKGLRTILNFGHTLGHAIEAAADFKKYNHGEAVALGMLIASSIGEKLGLIDKNSVRRIEQLIKGAGLPTSIKNIPLENIIKAIHRDKKFLGPKNRFVLPTRIGKVKIIETVPWEIIKEKIIKRFA